MTTEDSTARLGLRERKKIAARRALEKAAFELFNQKGFEATTVDDIAERAELSRATFFRYFGSKEDVLAPDDANRRAVFMQGLRDRSDEPVVQALKDSILGYVGQMDAADVLNAEVYANVMIGSRVLLGQAYEVRLHWVHEMQPILAERLAGEPDADLLVPLLADVTMSVLETSLRLATTHPDTDFPTIVERGFNLLRPDLGIH